MEKNAEGLPNIGEIIYKHTTEKRLHKSAWARAQGVNSSTISGYFKRKDMKLHTLIRICHILKYNFLHQLATTLPADYPPLQINLLSSQLETLQKENEMLKYEIQILKEVIGVKKT